jgi:hypothetical protein
MGMAKGKIREDDRSRSYLFLYWNMRPDGGCGQDELSSSAVWRRWPAASLRSRLPSNLHAAFSKFTGVRSAARESVVRVYAHFLGCLSSGKKSGPDGKWDAIHSLPAFTVDHHESIAALRSRASVPGRFKEG